MTLRQFYRSWWGWLLFAGIMVSVGFFRNWDKISISMVAVLGVTGVLRALLGTFKKLAIKRIAMHIGKMPAKQREKELEKVAPEYRSEVQREIDNLRR